MKIVIICMSGFTSTILTGTLSKYASVHQFHDMFVSGKISSFEEIKEDADMVLIAPQAVPAAEEMTDICRQEGIPCICLEEKEFVLRDAEAIYRKINTYRVQRKPNPTLCLKRKDLKTIYGKTVMYTAAMEGAGLMILLLGRIIQMETVIKAANVVCGCVGLYFLILIGFFYADTIKMSGILSAEGCVTGYLILVKDTVRLDDMAARESLSFMMRFGWRNLWLAALTGSITIFCIEGIRRLMNKTNPGVLLHNDIYSQGIPYAIIIFSYVVIRILVS